MKLIYCIAGLRRSGGMERVLTNKANDLAGQGLDVMVVTTDQCGEPNYFPLSDKVRTIDLGINYEANNGAGLLNKLFFYPFKQYRHRKKLSRLLKAEKADVVISMFDNEVSFLPTINDGSRKIVEIHFSRFKRLQYGRRGLWRIIDQYRSRMDLKIVRNYDRFVVLTEEDKGYWGKLPNIIVIPNARTFNPSQTALLDDKRVIAVGRYNYQKGFDDLIAAWSRVYPKHPDWQLHIFGDGELRTTLQQQIDDKGLGEVVKLQQSVKNIGDEYLKSSVLAMSSRYEGLPMALLEGQAYGLPIVSYTCKCGPRDIVTDGKDGFLVPEGDTDALADRIVKLMDDEVLRKQMGREARKNSERFSVEKVMKMWLELFKRVLDEP
ncbi:MAG: glycosyltransferase family 4 protein [Dysgonamonadaceae bacterium]|jgi:glycosyltransferase involved in cell wall biosynthesis|nr:glycosyltransferase family 4 protein [Dysgonamonadaceae bacterium]